MSVIFTHRQANMMRNELKSMIHAEGLRIETKLTEALQSNNDKFKHQAITELKKSLDTLKLELEVDINHKLAEKNIGNINSINFAKEELMQRDNHLMKIIKIMGKQIEEILNAKAI